MAIQAPLPGANRTHTSPFFRAQILGLSFLVLLLPYQPISAILLFLLDLISLIVPRLRNYLIVVCSFTLLLFLYTYIFYQSLPYVIRRVLFLILPINLSSIHHCRYIIFELSTPSLNLVLSLFLFSSRCLQILISLMSTTFRHQLTS